MAIESNMTRPGMNNGTGDDRALFHNKVQTDILRFFQSTNIGRELVTLKKITSGKSASFPVVGNAKANYHDVGVELDGTSIIHTERTITIDKVLEAHAYVGDIDEAMVEYDANSAYNESIGRALGKKYDEDLFRTIVLAAMINDSTEAAAAGLLAFADDQYTTDVAFAAAGDELKGDKIYAKLVEMTVQWTEKDIPGEPVIVLRPSAYFALLNNPSQTGMTWANDEASKSGKVPQILGHRVLTSPHIPQANDSANAAVLPKYRADFRKTVGVMFAKEAVGALELMSIQVRSDYVPTRLSTLIVGKMLVGFGILNHAAAIRLAEYTAP